MEAAEIYAKELTIVNSKALLAIMAGFVLGIALASCNGSDPTSTPTTAPTLTPPATPTPPRIPTPAARTIPEIIKDLTPSAVHIQTEAVQLDQFNRPSPGVGVGTGEIIDLEGHVLTNYHVISDAERVLVTLSDGRAIEAELIGGDPTLVVCLPNGFTIRQRSTWPPGLPPLPMGED